MMSGICFAPSCIQAQLWAAPHHIRYNRHRRVTCGSPHHTAFSTVFSKLSVTDGAVDAVAGSKLLPSQVLQTPSHWRLPVVGPLIDVAIGNTGPKLARKYGAVYRSRHFVGRAVIISKHSTICALQRNPRLLTSEHSLDMLRELIGPQNVAMLDGEQHLRLRSVLAPLFAPPAMRRVFADVQQSASALWSDISQRIASSSGPVDVETLVKRHFLRVTLVEIIRDFKMSVLLTSDSDKISTSEYASSKSFVSHATVIQALETISDNLYRPRVPPFLQASRNALLVLSSVITPILKNKLKSDGEIIKLLRSGSSQAIASKTDILSKQMDFITVLASQSDVLATCGDNYSVELSDEQLIEESKPLAGFFLAGFLTTAPTLLSCLVKIFENSTLHARLVEEQEKIPNLTLQDVNDKMPLLTATIMETLRCYPPATILVRHAKEDLYIERHVVYKGEAVVSDIWAGNRDPEVFENPDVFDPYRFLSQPEHRKLTSSKSVLTFGASGSPHFCLGYALAKMELKVTIATLLREYDSSIVKSKNEDFIVVPSFKPRQIRFDRCSP